MEFVDSHTHMSDKAYADGGAEAVGRAIAAGVTQMVLPGTRLDEFPPMEALRRRFPDNVFLSAGVHPTEITPAYEDEVEKVSQILHSPTPVVAVGEIGVDLYWDKSRRQEQMHAFRLQCELALEHNLPIIIHCREALSEVEDVLKSLPDMPRGVFHCFSGSVADVKRIRALGDFYFGIGGILTFKKSGLPEVLPAIGLNRILLETDSPYLAPVPFRGKTNESAFIPYIAGKVSECLGVTLQEVADITTDSARRLFVLPDGSNGNEC